MILDGLTALEIGRCIRSGELTAPEAAKYFLDKISADEAKNDGARIRAFVSVDAEETMARAGEVQRRIEAGEELLPLAGVPIAVKDNIATKAFETTAASKILQGFRSPYDATVIEKINETGLVILGKTNMDEFAMGSSTETSHYGVTRNPWDLSRVPGGSSGGSAAAVSGGFAPIALGSDTGGSIRQPCSFTNLVGAKPTYGTVSRYGLLAYGSSLDQIGPMARSAEDAAALLSIISGPDSRDSTNVAKAPLKFSGAFSGGASSAPSAAGLRLGIPANYFSEGVEPDVQGRIYEAAEELKTLGAEVVEFELPLIDYAVPTYLIIACAEASSNLSRYDGVKYGYAAEGAESIEDLYVKTRSDGFGTEVKRRIMLGSFALSSGYFDAYYKKALKVRRLIRDAFDDALEKFDAILCPVCPTAPYEIGGQIQNPLAMYLGDIYTTSANLTGLPALAVPAGFDSKGLPIGMQLIGKAFDDPLLFRLAIEYQKTTKWHEKRPI